MYRFVLQLVHSILFPDSYNRIVVDSLSFRDINALYRARTARAVVTLLPYRFPFIRSLMWEAKYHNNERARTLLAYALSKHLAVLDLEHSYIVPMPLTKKRERERGYNQVSEILKKLELFCESPTIEEKLLRRDKHGESQTRLSRMERLHNLFNAFSTNASPIPRETPIILVDDTLATGATMRAALYALHEAGFRNVHAVALAH